MSNDYKINIDENTYYPSGNIAIFPSSNAVDVGKLFTEYNGRHITINITDLNYVISPNPGGYDISFNETDNDIDIQPGKAMINGFEVNTDVVVSYRLPTADEITNEGYYAGYALLCLHTLFDSLENLSGNVQVGPTWYCEGIRVEYVSYEDYNSKPGEYLLLGGIKEDGTVIINKDKYTRIDAKYILVRMEEDPETQIPPTQSTNLLEFINNFLHGYWVKKHGDNEYGELLFKSVPDNYFDEGFDFESEDELTSTKFGVKVTKSGGTIIIKPETEAANNMVMQHLPGIIGFYKGLYRGDSNVTFGSSIKASGNNINTANYDSENSLEIVTDKGVIRIKQNYNSGPVLSVESNKTGHNGVESGKVIYANGEGGDIADTDITTAYTTTINYLIDSQGRIKTVKANDLTSFVTLDVTGENPAIGFGIGSLSSGIELNKNIDNAKGENTFAWRNILTLFDNIKVSAKNDTTNGGSIQAEGFIVAGKVDNPASIQVPDIVNTEGNRPLKSGDIYGTQVWSAVYNDLAEIFQIHPEDKDKIKPGMILAVDEKDPDYYVLADENNDCIVGVVSENPAFCCGGADCKCGVPVALAGRVKVKFSKLGYTPRVGNWAVLHPSIPGVCSSTLGKHSNLDGTNIGKIIKVIDNETVEIIVSLR